MTVPAYFAGLQGNIEGMPWPQIAAGAMIFVAPIVAVHGARAQAPAARGHLWDDQAVAAGSSRSTGWPWVALALALALT